MMRAAIAIGSNSTRMLAAEKQDGKLMHIFRGREETRLFLGLDEQGNILPERLEQTARAVERLADQARRHGAREVTLLATSACRDARNGQALADRIQALCGLEMRIISGEEEASLAFRAVTDGKRRLVMDIGGGSTELSIGEYGRIEWAGSAQMGASRLLRMRPIDRPQDVPAALEAAREALLPFVQRLRTYPAAPAMIGIGGSCTTLAAMQMGREAHGEAVEGKTVTLPYARRTLSHLSSLSLEQRMAVPGLPAARAIHMPHGLCILISAMELCGFEQLTVSGRTNLDGFLLSVP